MVSKNDYKKKYDICCVARLTEQKNPMKFLDVLYSIKKSKSDVKAVWVGEGSLEVEVKKRIYELGLADNVEMVGFQKNPYKYMACSKIFMLTSDWEGYGLVAFEALTLGLPCIVSNVGGLPKIVDDSCGMLCNKAGDFVHEAIELLNDVALNILYDPSNKSESDFWEKSAADYFSGLALGLFQDAKEEEVNLNSINVMSTVGEERYATSNYIKEYFGMKGEKSNAYMFASSTINAPNDTKGGLLATFRQKIRNFSTGESLSEMLSYSDFNMKDIGNGKTAVFMIIHDEKKTYHPLMTIFIKQCYETLIDVAQENGGKLPVRTNFILDEFANMPPLKDVTTMITAAANSSTVRLSTASWF